MVASADDVSADTPSSTARWPRRDADVLAVAGIGVAVIRWLLAIRRDHAAIPFDETAQLAIARTLGGGGDWSMFRAGTWQPGYGTIITPLHWFVDDPEWVYRSAIGINAVLAGVAAVLLAHIGRELTNRPLRECTVIAAGISVLPGAIVASSFAWSEQLLVTLSLGVLWGALVFVRSGDVRLAVLATGLANLAYLSHARGMPMVATSLLIVGWVLVRQGRWSAFSAVVAWTLAGFLVVRVYSAWVFDRVWTEPVDDNTAVATMRRLSDPLAVLDAALGQGWYLLVGTLGLVVAAAAWIWSSIRRPTARANATILLAWALPTIAISAVFMSGRTARADMFVYGRYNEVILGPLLFVGWIEFVRIGRSFQLLTRGVAAAIGLMIATGLAVHAVHGSELGEGANLSLTTPALIALDNEAPTRVLVPTFVAVVVIVTVIGLIRVVGPDSPLFRTAIVLMVAIGALRVGAEAMSFTARPLTDEQLAEFDELVPDGQTIVLHLLPPDDSPFISPFGQLSRLAYLQGELPDRRFDVNYDDQAGESSYVLAPTLMFTLVDEEAAVLWDDPNVPMSLWRPEP